MKHIVLLSLDTLRYDCIGYQPDKKELLKHDVLKYLKTPTLDEISEKSICFTQCISTNTYTTAAHASVLTGLYPSRHGVRAFYQSKLRKDIYSIAEILKVFGYTTVLATDTPVNFLPLDMNKGFDHVFDKDDTGVFQFLEKYKNEKIFLFAHFFDIHDPYLFTMCRSYDNSDYFSTLKGVYEQCIIPFPSETTDAWHIWRNLSGQIGRRKDVMFPLYVQGISKFDMNRFRTFFSRIQKLHILDDSLMIIFSDHGEGKKSNDNPDDFWHGGEVFDNVVRVPLIVYHRDFPNNVLDKTVSLVDIFPTIVENATGESVKDILPYSINGHTLLDTREREAAYCETSLSRNMLKFRDVQIPFLQNCSQMSSFLLQRAIRTRNKKFIYYGEPEN
ncbi:DUF229 domain-containing protein [bacterium]|nr:MAG: DUF229 domain-containing protein [bacterium]